MEASIFQKQSKINAPVEAVFRWHARPGAIERLSPPWDPLKIVHQTGGIEAGAEVIMRLNAGPVPLHWHARHTHFVENRMFRDIQITGPFAQWAHTHRFTSDGPDGCILEDHIEYALPFHPISTALMKPFVEKKLNRIFTYRHHTTQEDIAAHQRTKGTGPFNILISGASGLVGSVLIPFLTTGGHRVMRLVRRQPDRTKGEIYWNPAAGKLDLDDTDKIDAVVHLSGENIGEGRWTPQKKQRIIDSRVNTTRLVAQTIARMKTPPKVFLCASAIGYYGDRGDALCDESSRPGRDFISDVCKSWEAAVDASVQAGIRTVNLRIGVVLSPQGGALGKLLPPFRMGIGGKIGSGRQYMSWISMDDAVGAIHHAMCDGRIKGPVNLVSPNPAANLEFARTLASVLSRPAYFTVPKMAVETVFGEMGRETILSSTRVRPVVLEATGYPYRHPDLETALRHLLGKARNQES
ncbi:MAG: TIGR01777 family oxidoreductase [Desulfobacteraceae bacterium]|nr:TIGR01777 family oxidoreductase [Desulfobacteraceae bacterium]